MNSIQEFGFYLRQYSRIALLEKLRGIKKLYESKRLNFEEKLISVNLHHINYLFLFMIICYTLSALIFSLEFLYFISEFLLGFVSNRRKPIRRKPIRRKPYRRIPYLT